MSEALFSPAGGLEGAVGPLRGAQRVPGHGSGGPAARRTVVGFGFWLFLLSDIVMFSAFFAAYAVLAGQTAGGPGPRQLFDLGNVERETAFLLLSSFTCGLGGIAARERSWWGFALAMVVTFALGAGFLRLELHEFAGLIASGAGPARSAFLSAFFALVGCHGLHVGAGLVWLAALLAQTAAKGFRPDIQRRILCFALFWHALDIIWVAVFSAVYIFGVQP